MSDSDEYIVEHYFKPTIKHTTYDRNDDTYLEPEQSSEMEDECSESGEEIVDIKEHMDDSQCVVQEKTKQVEEPVVRSRFILYISNLSKDTTRASLENIFSGAGLIKSVRIPKKRLSNFAFVEMKDIEGYRKGLTFNLMELDGKKINVHAGSKNKKHISNKTKSNKKKLFQVFEKKRQEKLLNKKA